MHKHAVQNITYCRNENYIVQVNSFAFSFSEVFFYDRLFEFANSSSRFTGELDFLLAYAKIGRKEQYNYALTDLK